jgi:hypothetical protein
MSARSQEGVQIIWEIKNSLACLRGDDLVLFTMIGELRILAGE